MAFIVQKSVILSKFWPKSVKEKRSSATFALIFLEKHPFPPQKKLSLQGKNSLNFTKTSLNLCNEKPQKVTALILTSLRASCKIKVISRNFIAKPQITVFTYNIAILQTIAFNIICGVYINSNSNYYFSSFYNAHKQDIHELDFINFNLYNKHSRVFKFGQTEYAFL